MGDIPGKPFTDVVGEIRDGDLLAELTEELYAVMAAVRETRKAGSIKLAIKISPTGRDTVTLDAVHDSVIPKEPNPGTTFFVGRDNSLHRQDPNQPRLPLREVEFARNDPITVGEQK